MPSLYTLGMILIYWYDNLQERARGIEIISELKKSTRGIDIDYYRIMFRKAIHSTWRGMLFKRTTGPRCCLNPKHIKFHERNYQYTCLNFSCDECLCDMEIDLLPS